MSVDYNTNALCGFKLDIREVQKTKTQYDQDTGQPFAVKVFSHYDAYVDGIKVISTKDHEDKKFLWPTSYDDPLQSTEYAGLLLHRSGGEGSGPEILGVSLAELDDWGGESLMEFSPKVPKVVAKFAAKHCLQAKFYLLFLCY